MKGNSNDVYDVYGKKSGTFTNYYGGGIWLDGLLNYPCGYLSEAELLASRF